MTKSSDAEVGPAPFQPLGKYAWPTMPTQEALRRWIGRLHGVFNQGDKPLIADDHLRKATRDLLDAVVAPPACGPLERELESAMAAWIDDPQPDSWLKLIVLPPCDQNQVIRGWAERNDHAVLEAPNREAMLSAATLDRAVLRGTGVLVIPRLEDWFVRHHRGLTLVRSLLDEIVRLQRHCVIGCNSWAWAFLAKATGADTMLPTAQTFKAFDEGRLRRWFAELAEHDTTRAIRFRLPGSGKDVLARDAGDKPVTDFFETLASRSLGIPWVAWHLWRDSLRSSDDPDGPATANGDEVELGEQTLWIAALDEYTLPGASGQSGLLTLQALLIHGGLSEDELQQVLPVVGQLHIVHALVAGGLVERLQGRLVCRPSAYPAIRSGLKSAGYSMDQL